MIMIMVGNYFSSTSSGSSFSRNHIETPPAIIDYFQSTQQAFYFIEELNLTHYDIESGDWIVAFNGNTVVGSWMWNGKYTDIPVMGYDDGYVEEGIEIATIPWVDKSEN